MSKTLLPRLVWSSRMTAQAVTHCVSIPSELAIIICKYMFLKFQFAGRRPNTFFTELLYNIDARIRENPAPVQKMNKRRIVVKGKVFSERKLKKIFPEDPVEPSAHVEGLL